LRIALSPPLQFLPFSARHRQFFPHQALGFGFGRLAHFLSHLNQLGFDITYQEPADDPFFGIVRRGGAMILLLRALV